MFQKGVRVDEDEKYDPSKEKRADLSNADRDRTDTERGMDDLLFGKGAVRRPRRTPQPPEPPKQATPPPDHKAPLPVQSKTQTEVGSKNTSVISNKSIGESSIGIQSKATSAMKKNPIKPTDMSSPKGSSMTGASIMNDRRSEPMGIDSQISLKPLKRNLFNRPSYLRKLKKVAQDFNYKEVNLTKHRYKDVVKLNESVPEKALSQECRDFVDKEFPPEGISVGPQFRKDENVMWRRANEIFQYASVFGKYVDPNDIEMGRMSSANFLSILSCLAEREMNIKKLIQDQKINQNGFYYIRLNINSVWRYISVDDFLPEIEGDMVGAASFNDFESELSVALIEKAYAKAYHGYNIFQRKTEPQNYLRDLTGSIIQKTYPQDADFIERIETALANNWTVVAVPSHRIDQLGMDVQYNLGIINVNSQGKVTLRNSWGTLSERSPIKFTKEGLFELSLQEARKYLDYVLVAETEDQQFTSTVQSRHRSNFYSCYTVKLKKFFSGYISIYQWEERLFPSAAQYKYSPFRIIVQKRVLKKRGQGIASGFSYDNKNLDLFVELNAGEYAIYCIGSWDRQNYDYNLVVRGSQKVEFEKCQTTMVPNMISQCLQTVNLQQGKRAAKGHVDERILYHKQSNLVLLSLTNISEKVYNYTEDLSKIKFETLQVINAVNQEQKFKGMMKDEIARKKEKNNAKRDWNLTLQPKENYTWVIATSQDYREENFRNWGFR